MARDQNKKQLQMRAPQQEQTFFKSTQDAYKEDTTTNATMLLATNHLHLIALDASLSWNRDQLLLWKTSAEVRTDGYPQEESSTCFDRTVRTTGSAECTR